MLLQSHTDERVQQMACLVQVHTEAYMIRSCALGSSGVITLVPLVPWKTLGLCCSRAS